MTLPFLQLYFVAELFQNNAELQAKMGHPPLARCYWLQGKAWNRVGYEMIHPVCFEL